MLWPVSHMNRFPSPSLVVVVVVVVVVIPVVVVVVAAAAAVVRSRYRLNNCSKSKICSRSSCIDGSSHHMLSSSET